MELKRLSPFDAAQGFDGLRRLSGRKIVDRVRRRGQTWKGKHMKIIYMKHEIRNSKSETNTKSEMAKLFVGTLASTHLDKSAVKRNRMRRRCREALRIVLTADRWPLIADVQLLISPRSSSLTCAFSELEVDARTFLTHLTRHA